MKPMERYSLQSRLNRAESSFTAREEARDAAIMFVAKNGVEGDYLEFGAYLGVGIIQAYYTTLAIQELSKRDNALFVSKEMRGRPEIERYVSLNLCRRFVAFDSFSGFPAPTEDYEKALMFEGDLLCNEKEFWNNLVTNEVDVNRVLAVPGYFDKTLNAETKDRIGLTAAAVINLDCDLYQSTSIALDFITDIIVDGSIILFDDWHLFKSNPKRGQQKAFNGWAEKNKISYSSFGMPGLGSFIVHR